jgi:hypothetical protein
MESPVFDIYKQINTDHYHIDRIKPDDKIVVVKDLVKNTRTISNDYYDEERKAFPLCTARYIRPVN